MSQFQVKLGPNAGHVDEAGVGDKTHLVKTYK